MSRSMRDKPPAKAPTVRASKLRSRLEAILRVRGPQTTRALMESMSTEHPTVVRNHMWTLVHQGHVVWRYRMGPFAKEVVWTAV